MAKKGKKPTESQEDILSTETSQPSNTTALSKNKKFNASFVFILSIGVLIILLLMASIFKILNFNCISRDLKPTCSVGYCLVLTDSQITDIRSMAQKLQEAKIEMLIVNKSSFSNKSEDDLVAMLNKIGIGLLFKVDISSAASEMDILNNGYIVTGVNLSDFNETQWRLIQNQMDSVKAHSCVEVCLYIEVTEKGDLTKLTLENRTTKGLCGYYFQSKIGEDFVKNKSENDSDFKLDIMLHNNFDNDTLRSSSALNISLAFTVANLTSVSSSEQLLNEIYKMREKLDRSEKTDNFRNVTANGTDIAVKGLTLNLRINYSIALIPKKTDNNTTEITVKSILSSQKDWSYLLGPKSLAGSLFDVKSSNETLNLEDEAMVIALY